MKLPENGDAPRPGGAVAEAELIQEPQTLDQPDDKRHRAPSDRYPGGFGVVPVALMRDPESTPMEMAVYAAIASCVNYETGHGSVWFRRIAERAGVANSTARKHAASLKARGYLRMSRRRGCPYIFQLLSTDEDKRFTRRLEGLIKGIGEESYPQVRRETAHQSAGKRRTPQSLLSETSKPKNKTKGNDAGSSASRPASPKGEELTEEERAENRAKARAYQVDRARRLGQK